MSLTPVCITCTDYDRLELLLDKLPQDTPGALALRAELDRADIVEPQQLPPDVVSMNSTVSFITAAGKRSQLTLVYPKDVAQSPDSVSVLAPIGSALLGLKQGASIRWPLPDGSQSQITVEAVLYQPEREGRYYR